MYVITRCIIDWFHRLDRATAGDAGKGSRKKDGVIQSSQASKLTNKKLNGKYQVTTTNHKLEVE